ncbi:DUF2207 domain-containing protein [Microbacterium sp. AK031]|uniref:DUF2207 domain-containing protein n=1 Tax=Microbacterium sp. AK031 TaxID=2723076 RepID=UPI0021676ADA|nr:DUF2207 domain-containing protein [Microbacterium sp. AK031]MCS3843539.1 putative membrane protein YgcG [Microbacterium sp. AK031]
MIRRTLPRLIALLVGVTALTFAASTAAASAAEPAAGVDDFGFSSWDATYEVGVDHEGRATLHVEETRVAEFPDFDQNRGIVAGYPDSYEGAGLGTRIISVRDEKGDDVPYEIEKDDGIVYVLTGDDDYVHGATTYIIEYEMRDVIIAAERTNVDELYWDLLPLDSTQNIDAFHAEVVFDDALRPHLTGASSCYQGPQGSTATCDLTEDAGVFTVSAKDLSAGEGVTVAIALEPGTITQPSARQPNAATDVLPYAIGGGAALLSVGGWVATSAMIRSRRRGTGIVVAQYDVPDSMPPLLASAIVPKAKNSLTAQIVHLAVRGLLRLEDLPEEGATKKRRPRLRRIDGPIPDPLDERALKALFNNTETDIVMKMPKNSAAFAKRMVALLKAGPKAAEERGLTTRARSRSAQVIQMLSLVALVVMIGLLGWGLFTGRASAGPVFLATLLCAIVVIVSSVVAFKKHTVLTDEGALQLEYLEGVREFIRVAEADRLRMLQSYSGAERRSDGSVDVIHVYEKLLPYAILFGQEREWGEVLEVSYAREQQSPGWIDGSSAGLVVRMAAFSAATRSSSTYSAPSTGSSSSFGGSAGGGFSGGGGGGGFSGGR